MTMPQDQDPVTAEPFVSHGDDSLTQEEILPSPGNGFPAESPDSPHRAGQELEEDGALGQVPGDASAAFEPMPMFHSWSEPAYIPPPPRIPHLGHLLLLAPLALFGLFGSSLVVRSALHFDLFGISTVQAAASDVHYTIASMAALYLIAFISAVLIFPLLWHKSFFAGVQWNASAAGRHFRVLLGAACICFLLAMVDELVLPGPTNAPIDKLFESRAAAWLLFGFGVTFAPFFEELAFRGFLLPALCTAFDWSMEKAVQINPPPLDAAGHPQWSLSAMVFASIATSVPFALMHAEQTAWSLGPFLLLVCVSLVLCWARLATRSLAASVLVHASYNLLLFSLMLLGTQGFKHLDKM
ncbi:MAG: lysostaphin resistance A-like protein [Terracidiphilus sp.]|jgi:membrane protease YdiL (CAAX protease family)